MSIIVNSIMKSLIFFQYSTDIPHFELGRVRYADIYEGDLTPGKKGLIVGWDWVKIHAIYTGLIYCDFMQWKYDFRVIPGLLSDISKSVNIWVGDFYRTWAVKLIWGLYVYWIQGNW